MNQQPLFGAFDIALATALRDAGIDRASEARADVLALARFYVRKAARGRPDRTATADDATRGLEAAGLPDNALGNAAGALFRGKGWTFTGRWKASERSSNHAHQNRVWRLNHE